MGDGTMVRAADGDGERVGRISGDFTRFRKQAADHEGDLRLVGRACADDGLLHLGGREFRDLELGARQRRHGSAARLTEQQGRARVDVDEGLLDRGFLWRVSFDHGAQLHAQFGQTVGHVGFCVGLDDAVRDPGETRAVHGDHAPAGVAQARIDAEDSNHLVHSTYVWRRTNELRTRQELTRRKPSQHRLGPP
jgi:hypothetical protein